MGRDRHLQRTKSERVVERALRAQMPANAVLLTNVRFTDGAYGDVEADALLFLPGHGIAVIEIKGGQVLYADGRWWVATRKGRRETRPIEQARRSKHALRSYALRQPEGPQVLPRVEWFVAMPFTEVTGDLGPEGRREQLIGRGDLASAVERITAALSASADASPVPSERDVHALLQLLHRPMAGTERASAARRRWRASLIVGALLASLGAVEGLLLGAATWLLASGALLAVLAAGFHSWIPLAGHPIRRRLISATLAATCFAGGASAAIAVAPQIGATTSCNSSYAPCVPVVPDLDCADLSGTVQVLKDDPYGLDRDGDGIGCEWNATRPAASDEATSRP